jgi:hypothetical protein
MLIGYKFIFGSEYMVDNYFSGDGKGFGLGMIGGIVGEMVL